MKLSLIGMSNSGKSYWSKKLEDYGFKRFSSDDYIEEILEEDEVSIAEAGFMHGYLDF